MRKPNVGTVVKKNDDINLSISESARKISEKFGFSLRTCIMYSSIIRRFKSLSEYLEHLAKQKGFKSVNEYHKHLAKQRGFKSLNEYHKHLAKQRGFKSLTGYQIHLAKQRGFKSLTEYQTHLAKQMGFKSHSAYKEFRVIMRGFSSICEYNHPHLRQKVLEQREFEEKMERKGKEIETLVYSETPLNSRFEREELKVLMDKLMKELPNRAREVVYGVEVEGRTLNYFAEQYGCTRQNVSKIRDNALRKLKNKARPRGLHLFLEVA